MEFAGGLGAAVPHLLRLTVATREKRHVVSAPVYDRAMYPDIRERLVNSGVDVPAEGTVTLYHAASTKRLAEIERTLVVAAGIDDDGKRRVYVASDPAIAEVIPHAQGAVAIEVDVDLDLELGMGDSPAKGWVELVYEVPDTEQGLPVTSARRM